MLSCLLGDPLVGLIGTHFPFIDHAPHLQLAHERRVRVFLPWKLVREADNLEIRPLHYKANILVHRPYVFNIEDRILLVCLAVWREDDFVPWQMAREK
jgi:hypothetical protein